MKKMSIYEPALCCETGLCGVTVDPELLRITTVLNNLKNKGIIIERYNLNSMPMEFVKNNTVNQYVNEKGVEGLPVTLVDGKIVITRRYPANDEILNLLELSASTLLPENATSQGCCCSGEEETDCCSDVTEESKEKEDNGGCCCGVGKTSVACATAVKLADEGKKTLLVSTDPASNLQDVFHTNLDNKGVQIKDVPNLVVANLDPVQAAAEYRESVIAPYRGKLPESVIGNMEEQLSGSCTVEIAAFNEFSRFITDKETAEEYDFIIFDTAPTGHTLRMLALPSAWSGFISESTHGASCLGQLSGLDDKKEIYKRAVDTLADSDKTTLILVSRPEETPLKEAYRASVELSQLHIDNQIMVMNGMLLEHTDEISKKMYDKQQRALNSMPDFYSIKKMYYVPLRAYNIMGIEHIRSLLRNDDIVMEEHISTDMNLPHLQKVIDDLYLAKKKVIFTMGKGGVGKTTVAATIAEELADKGVKVHLATTDPAAHLKYVISESSNITMSSIDEKAELKLWTKQMRKWLS